MMKVHMLAKDIKSLWLNNNRSPGFHQISVSTLFNTELEKIFIFLFILYSVPYSAK